MPPAVVYVCNITILAVGERAIALVAEEFGKAKDGVERGPQFVTHHGKELVLELVGAFGFFFCTHQIFRGTPELLLFFLEFPVKLDGFLVGRNEQVQNLLPFRGDIVFLTSKVNFYPHLQFVGSPQIPVRQDEIDAREKIIFVIRLPDKIISAALQALNDVLWAGKRCH